MIMEYKVTVTFHEIHIIEINVEDPESAANATLKLFQKGRLNPQVNEIAVFEIDDEFGLEPPLFVLTQFN
jgi:hypothetical protein